MNNLEQGLVIMLVGMAGTLLSLGFIILIVNIMKRILPYKEEQPGKENG